MDRKDRIIPIVVQIFDDYARHRRSEDQQNVTDSRDNRLAPAAPKVGLMTEELLQLLSPRVKRRQMQTLPRHLPAQRRG
jgi:hypothetical protein